MPVDTGEHKAINSMDVLKARFEDHLVACAKQDADFKEDFQDVWVEINKLRPMVWKMWAVATALPAIISIGSYLVFKNG